MDYIESAIVDLRRYFDMETDDDPYRIYKLIEDHKSELSRNIVEYLAIQEHCLWLICKDLSEHGESNLYFYAKGKISKDTFQSLYDEIFNSLLAELRNKKILKTKIWVEFRNEYNDVPRRIKMLLGISEYYELGMN